MISWALWDSLLFPWLPVGVAQPGKAGAVVSKGCCTLGGPITGVFFGIHAGTLACSLDHGDISSARRQDNEVRASAACLCDNLQPPKYPIPVT